MMLAIDRAAADLAKTDPKLARRFLTNWSVGAAERLFEAWRDLAGAILTKHNDVGAEILGALEGYSRFTSKEQRMARAKTEALECQRCGLCSTRQNVVFGEGTLWTPLMIITEGPNLDEDTVGRPVVGKDNWFMG